MTITYEWRGESENAALDALHAEGFGHPVQGADRTARLYGHSLGWVCSRHDGEFVGFVDVAWDGGAHAFLPDTVVAPAHRRAAVGSEPVAEAARGAGR
ncbi:GNAT family N-acetyltransferase, partial [Streptomyces sp. SID3915]|uniref:GNAT family N-acetyltransferase n=2 Tax=Streptomyces TaxID=1883 RepID=UPI00136F11CE